MNENEESAKKSGWGDLGHKWITAFAALLTALTGAGFFIGFKSAPEAKQPPPVSTNATAVTVTVTAAHDAQPAGTTTASSEPTNTDRAVYWSGELTWGRLNLDIKPPNYTDGENLANLGSDFLYSASKTRVTVWKKGAQPGKEDCTSAVDADGTNQVEVAKGNKICGRTAEGRTFLLDVISVGTTLRTQSIVWNI